MDDLYVDLCNGRFTSVEEKLEENRKELSSGISETHKRIDESNGEIIKLREIVNNGLTNRVKLVLRMMFGLITAMGLVLSGFMYFMYWIMDKLQAIIERLPAL